VSEFSFDRFTVDVDRLEVRRDELVLALEPKAFRVLLYLIQHRERAVSKEELMAHVWAGSFVTDNALTRVVAQIRKQLGDNAREPRYIETLATTGYRFVAPVWENVKQTNETARPVRPRWTGAAVLVSLLVIGGALFLRLRPDTRPRLTALRQLTTSAGADLWPTFSPDGSQIAYSSNTSGDFQIYVRSVAPGSVERQITTDRGGNLQPSWSPDGKYIAYVSRSRGIGIMPASGGATRFVTDSGDSPRWSWDSRQLVYRVLRLNIDPSMETTGLNDNALMLLDVASGASRPLTRPGTPAGGHTQPVWMRDGRHVLFSVMSSYAAETKPWNVDVQTGSTFPVAIEATSVTNMAISPDSRSLYFVGWGDGVWQSRLAGDRAARPEILIPASGARPRDLALSADGTRIAVSQQIGANSIWSVQLDASGAPAGPPKPIIQDRSLRHAEVTFSADGTKLAYTSGKLGGEWAVYVANPDGSSPEQLTPGGQDSGRPSWFGRELAVAHVVRSGGTRRYRVDVLGGPRRTLDIKLDLAKADRPRVSRDGRMIAAHVSTLVGTQVVVEDLATHNVRAVTPPDRDIGFPAISPDGKWIVAEERVQGNVRMVIVPSGGGEIRPVAPGVLQAFSHDWSPDSERISFTAVKDGVSNVFWVSRITGQVEQLTNFTTKAAFVRYPAWSPKGDQIVFERNDLVANIYVGELK
jgi:Tol biopolymer transport system component/DNA-binding winged helix-turn-helix (wHTH) protein